MPSRTDNAIYVVEQFTLLGIPAQAGSRVMKMHDVLQREHIPWGDPDMPIALQAERDLAELGFIFEQLTASRNDPTFQKLCQDLLTDSALPQDDRENSQGRDSQFELYLAAVCQKAGMTPVGYDEPDVTCHIDGSTFSIAAKRIKNEKQGRRRITKAADQIEKAGRPGIIAIDMSLAWNTDNVPVTSQLHNQAFNAVFEEQSWKFLARHGNALINKGLRKNVLGIVVFKFSIHVVNGKWKPQRSATWREFGEDKDPKRMYNQFCERFNSVRSTMAEKVTVAK